MTGRAGGDAFRIERDLEQRRDADPVVGRAGAGRRAVVMGVEQEMLARRASPESSRSTLRTRAQLTTPRSWGTRCSRSLRGPSGCSPMRAELGDQPVADRVVGGGVDRSGRAGRRGCAAAGRWRGRCRTRPAAAARAAAAAASSTPLTANPPQQRDDQQAAQPSTSIGASFPLGPRADSDSYDRFTIAGARPTRAPLQREELSIWVIGSRSSGRRAMSGARF